MSKQGSYGQDWTDEEVDLIVSDYFAMLAKELAGEPYVKRRYAERLMDLTGRTHRSVEFKYMNVSAALETLALPHIRGYRPMPNIQRSLTDAIERWLSAHPEAFEFVVPAVPSALAERDGLFIEAPPPLNATSERSASASAAGLQRLVRKFDPVERDFRNRQLGKAGEELIVSFEQRRLERAERPDLARKVRWVAQEDGDGAGYDIRSFNPSGDERLIEVKTTRGPQRTPFLITRNERSVAEERPEAFRLYRVYEFGDAPKLFKLRPPLEHAVVLRPEVFKAGFG